MHYDFTPEKILLTPTADEYPLIRSAIKKRVFGVLTSSEQLKPLEGWQLADFLDKTSSEPCLIRASCEVVTFYSAALEAALPDLSIDEMKLAEPMIRGMAAACEGFELLQSQVATPDFVPEDF